jgi:hypothetical protein
MDQQGIRSAFAIEREHDAMRPSRACLFGLVAALSAAVLSPVSTIYAAPAPAAPATPSAEQVARIAALIQKKDPDSLDAAIKEMKRWAASGKVPGRDLAVNLLPALAQAGRGQEAGDICLEIVLANPSSGNIQDFFSLRIKLLATRGKDQEALQAAKSLYNGCDMKYIEKAIPLVAQMLERTHPDDKTIGRRFSLAQAQSAGKAPAAARAGAPAAAAEAVSPDDANLLKSIKIDTAPYEKALARWATKNKQGALTIDEAHDLEKYANLLLVADKGEEAEKIFRDLIRNTPGEAGRQKTALLRALKAADGNLTRASATQQIQDDKALP